MQVAGDALTLGYFGEVLDFVVGHAQLGQGAIALREVDVAASDRKRHSAGIKEKPSREVEDLFFDRGQGHDPGHQPDRRALSWQRRKE